MFLFEWTLRWLFSFFILCCVYGLCSFRSEKFYACRLCSASFSPFLRCLFALLSTCIYLGRECDTGGEIRRKRDVCWLISGHPDAFERHERLQRTRTNEQSYFTNRQTEKPVQNRRTDTEPIVHLLVAVIGTVSRR